MKFETNDLPQTFEVSGQELRVNFDVKEIEREDMDGEKRKSFAGEQVVLPVAATRSQIVEAIVATRYTTGAEIALNRLPDDNADKQEYLAFVEAAKVIAGSRK